MERAFLRVSIVASSVRYFGFGTRRPFKQALANALGQQASLDAIVILLPRRGCLSVSSCRPRQIRQQSFQPLPISPGSRLAEQKDVLIPLLPEGLVRHNVLQVGVMNLGPSIVSDGRVALLFIVCVRVLQPADGLGPRGEDAEVAAGMPRHLVD